jgi:hypothetical protein
MNPDDNQTPKPPDAPQPGADRPATPVPPSTPPVPAGPPQPAPAGLPTQPGAPSSPVPPLTPGGLPPKGKTTFLIVMIAVAVLLLSIIGYFIFIRSEKSANDAANTSNSTAANATDMATLQKVSFAAPKDMSGFSDRDTGVPGNKDYVSKEGDCELIFGTVGEDLLPGADLNAIVEPQLAQLRGAGSKVTGPNAGEALILENASGGESYRMPTLSFEFSEPDGPGTASVRYSAVLLKSNERAVVSRSCISKDGPVVKSKLDALEAKAAELTVTKQ